jgi:hypothetical protein
MRFFSSAVSPAGDIALVYDLITFNPGYVGSNYALYAAFLSPSTEDGSVGGLQLQQVELLVASLGQNQPPQNQPYVFWSNASQTFIVSDHEPGAGNQIFITLNDFLANGQTPGGLGSVPWDPSVGGVGNLVASGSVGESGNFLGVSYTDPGSGAAFSPWITILDENNNLVGNPAALIATASSPNWVSVAGTAQGFAYFYDQETPASVGEVFVSTAEDAGIFDDAAVGQADASALPGFSFSGEATAGRAIADDVGTGGFGGVGIALLYNNGVSFAYVNADGVGHRGPDTVFAHTFDMGNTAAVGDLFSITNLNGSFVLSLFSQATNSTQVAASGICP